MKMPRNQKQRLQLPFYSWTVFRRGNVFYGDGRGCIPNLGKHSLGTKSYEEAISRLKELDAVMAKQHNHPDFKETNVVTNNVSITAGWEHFMDRAARDEIAGGVS